MIQQRHTRQSKNMINLGIAVAMDNGGLIVPVIKSDGKNLVGIARDLERSCKESKRKSLRLMKFRAVHSLLQITEYSATIWVRR